MKKILKSIFSTAIVSASISPIFAATSCSKKVDWNDDSYKDFIFQRTFCMKAYGSGSTVSGTMWILSDATPSEISDFTYWCLTNNHVITEMKNHSATSSLAVAQNATSDGFESEGESFCEIGWSAMKLEDDSKVEFNPPNTDGIDLSIMKINLGAVMTIDSVTHKPKYPIMYDSLTKVNEYAKTNGYTGKIAQTVSSKSNFSNFKIATAGYPAIESTSKYIWETQTIAAGELSYATNVEHYDKTAMTIKDVSPNYYCKVNKRTKPAGTEEAGWMDSGASGSMMVTKCDNQWQIIGIYWGGFSDEAKTQFYPCFSVFNSDKKNFVKDYII